MKKLFYLFLGIIGISSCTNDNFIESQTETTNSEIVHKKLTYEQASKAINNQPAFDEKLKNSFHDNFNLLSSNLNKTTNSTEESNEILIDYFFDPVHNNETYSFIIHEFTGETENDYLEKFVLTVEDGEQKVGYLRYYPTTDFSTEYFTGNVQVLSLNHTEVYESYIENGVTIQNQTNSRSTDCITKITFGSTRCSNGGHHRYGIPCTGNAVNDAYQYLLVDVFCRDNISFPRDVSAPSPVFIMDNNPNRGGGGNSSNNSQAQQNSFMNSLPNTAKQYLNEKPEIKYSFMMYLAGKQFSTESKAIATQLSILIANDNVLNSNNLLTELIVKQILFSDKYTVQEFEDFWSNLTPAQKAIFDNYAINGISANGNFLKPSVQTFLSWAFNYLIDNPTVTVEQFENWFSLEGSLNDDLIKELQPYTTLKFDEFININKDLDDFNVYLQNSNPLDSPWLKQAREYAQKLESWSSSLGPKAKQKARETIDETFKYALNKTAQYLYSNVGNLTEIQKETQFQNNGKNGVAILLHDFANGLGKNTRNFPLNYDITQQFIAGNVLNDIKSDFLAKLIEKNLTYNQFVSNGNTINGGYAFSPDHTSAQDSFDKHVNANWVQFFIGGASTVYQPTNDYGWISVTISNSTSRSSLMLHVGDNYPRNGNGPHKPLSTISQTFTFRMKVL